MAIHRRDYESIYAEDIISEQEDQLDALVRENDRLEGIIAKRDARIDNLNKYCNDLERWNDEWRSLIFSEMDLRIAAEKRANALKKELDAVSLRHSAVLEMTVPPEIKIEWEDCEATNGEHPDWWFDREICGLCDSMHYVCSACGQTDCGKIDSGGS